MIQNVTAFVSCHRLRKVEPSIRRTLVHGFNGKVVDIILTTGARVIPCDIDSRTSRSQGSTDDALHNTDGGIIDDSGGIFITEKIRGFG